MTNSERATNYIKELEQKTRRQHAEVLAFYNGINDLRAYLTSDKFAVDPTVQTADVMARLHEIVSAASAAYDLG